MHDIARLGLLEIEREALLVAVVGFGIEGWPILQIDAAHPQHAAAWIAALAMLDLDDLGAEITEHRRAHRPLLPDRPVDHPNSVQRHRHSVLQIAIESSSHRVIQCPMMEIAEFRFEIADWRLFK